MKLLLKAFLLPLITLLCLAGWMDPYHDEVKAGNGKYLQKLYEDAANHYRKARPCAPDKREQSKLKFNEGAVQYQKGDYDAAIDSFRQSLQSEDRDVQKKAFFNMGNVYLKKGNMEEAVNAYVSALKIDPNYLPAKKNLEYLMKKKDEEKNREQDKNQEGQKQPSRGKDEKGKDGKNKAEKQKSSGGEARMSRDQVMRIMESMKNKPVRRDKGKGDGERYLEKAW